MNEATLDLINYIIWSMNPVDFDHRSTNQPCAVCNAADEGRNPSWNEVFKFQISSTAANVQHKLVFRILDHDNFSSDDFLGEASINVTDLISIGVEKGTSELKPAKYSVVAADNSYHGEIRVGITFTAAKVEEDGGQVGGWMHSYRD
uniref:Uncharacterized protein n=1 Tax=Avena sativa TaxID=4498 RepID=A0ACD5W3D9_AVESA